MSEEVAIRAAAARLGVTEWAVRKAVLRGELRELPGPGPARLDMAEVDRFRRARQAAALERFAARGTDLVELAGSVRAHLRPYPGTAPGKVAHLGADVVAVFGAAALHATAVREGCGWCASDVAAQLLHTDPPVFGEVMLALLGKPCQRDMRRFAAAEMGRLRVQVHGPAAARTGPVTAAGPSSPPASPVWRSRPAQPVAGDDDGKALVARRLRQTRERLKAAKRAGDEKYAIRLQQTLRALTADASAIDGLVAAAARPGTLRCGHQLAARCACPRRASSRGQR